MQATTLNALNKVCDDLVTVANLVREDEKNAINSNDHVVIIKHYNNLRLGAERIKEAREALAQMSDRLSHQIIPDVVRDLKERTGEKPPFRIEGVGRVSITYRYACSIIDKVEGYKYLRANNAGHLITETVNASTMSAYVRNLLETEGRELPPDLFKVSTSPFTSITKAG